MLNVFTKKKLLVINNKTYQQINNIKFDPLEGSYETYTNLINSIFSKIPNRSYYVYLTDHNSLMYDFEKTDEGIKIVTWFVNDDFDPIRYYFEYSFKEKNGVTYFKEGLETLSSQTRLRLDMFFMNKLGEDIDTFFGNNLYEILMRTIIFIELSKDRVKLVDMKPKDNFGSITKGNLVKNETNRNLTIVDSLWSVTLMSVGEFKVRGHFRLQKCGVGFSEVKLVYIDEFIKTHYIRKSTRELRLN